ncbi:hypothetical protein N7494_004835 [Penicillium frequentans]|uniref:Uncharacterized protein n=1 Tax=Penicillium frequentans TaxID=3151616 RepID=A0AAD6D1E4_9EURO|nr:hypothetical protein N7494_004835 [Penicillium glabrum]
MRCRIEGTFLFIRIHITISSLLYFTLYSTQLNSTLLYLAIMTNPQKSKTDSEHARLQNDFGADYWIRNQQEHRHSTAGRGLFAGLQDVKSYNVDNGWARRKSGDVQTGLFGSIWNRFVGGTYHPPTD